jgi:DNA-binding CsgD family transcriptional regulator/tetratricopeptide (TPR) repeat protein
LLFAKQYSNDNEEIGVSLNKIGIVHYYKGEIDSAAYYIQASIPFFIDQILKANGLNNLALMNKYLDNRDLSIANYQEAIQIYKSLKDTLKQIAVLNNISGLHSSLDQLNDAEAYAIKAEKLSIFLDNKEGEMDAKSSLANVYYKRKDYESAVQLYQIAFDYYDGEGNINSKISAMVNLANCYGDMGDVPTAIEKYKYVLFLMDSSQLNKNKEAVLINTASSYQELNSIDSAKSYYFKALKFSRENKIVLRYISIYKGLSEIYKVENNIDSSLFYKDLQLALKDSVDQAEKAKKVLELEAKYQNKELKGDIDKGKQELTQSERKLELFSSSLFIILTILIITVFVVVIIYKQYTNKKSEAAEFKIKVDSQEKEVSSLSKVIQEKEKVIDNLSTSKPAHPYPSNLTPLTSREKEVLLGVKDGLKDQEIADQLFLSITTVRTHLRKAYVKLDVRNRAEAIAFISNYEI